MRIHCAECGEEHDLSAGEIGFSLPDAYHVLDEGERTRRGEADSDLCRLDDRRFIRGTVCLPILGEGRSFCWGVWAEIARTSFKRYLELFSDPLQNREPPFSGHLANELPGYSSTLGLEMRITLVSETERPQFTVLTDHNLAVEQGVGIRLERVLELMSPFIHANGG